MVTSTAPSAWRAISPVSSVTWWRPKEKVFLMDFTGVFLLSGSAGTRVSSRPRAGERGRKRKAPRAPAGVVAGPFPASRSQLAQAEALDQRAVGLDLGAFQVVEQAASRAHHLEQAAAG